MTDQSRRQLEHDRDLLQRLLADHAIIEWRPDRQIVDRSGNPTPWVYYGGDVILSPEGLQAMTSVILDKLSTFKSTQIATYGVSAIPILAGCIAQSDSKYTGLVIRKDAKRYGLRRKIDGPIDRTRPVVLVDESVSSGTTAQEAILALEQEGLTVEGVLCVVEFSGYGAAQWLRGRGYRVVTVFDVWKDLRPIEKVEAKEDPEDFVWSHELLPPNKSPAEVARYALEMFLREGRLPQPPLRLDRDYDAGGGTFISVRRRCNDERLLRAGIMRSHLQPGNACRDLVVAAYRAAKATPPTTNLEDLKFSVSFVGQPESICAGQIDHRKYALAVRGLGPLDRIGFALPNAPHYDDELEQYWYARCISRNFWKFEPHELYRHSVERVVEPGCSWPTYGAPRRRVEWFEDDRLTEQLAARVRQLLDENLGDSPESRSEVLWCEEPICAVGVTIYCNGLRGCALSFAEDPGLALDEATRNALTDDRYQQQSPIAWSDEPTVVVSALHRRRSLGQISVDRLKLFYRLGRDTLMASEAGKAGLVLAHFAVHQSLTQEEYQKQVLFKAGCAGKEVQWTAFETASWAISANGGRRLEQGFSLHNAGSGRCTALMERIANFVLAQRLDDGLPAYAFSPWSGAITKAGTATRILIAATGLLEASLKGNRSQIEAAESIVKKFISGDRTRTARRDLIWDCGSDAQLLTCLSFLRDRERYIGLARRLTANLRRLFYEDGAIYSGLSRMGADLDFLSGSVLLALAKTAAWVPDVLTNLDLTRCHQFYQNRFRLSHPWGIVWWHGQAWSALTSARVDSHAFAFEMVDWAIDRQSECSGAFLVDGMEPRRYSFLTGCVLEAVAEAGSLALKLGENSRYERYAQSWRRGVQFLDSLTIGHIDTFFSGHAAPAAGGVRPTRVSSELRIDYAGHALLALAKGLTAFGEMSLEKD